MAGDQFFDFDADGLDAYLKSRKQQRRTRIRRIASLVIVLILCYPLSAGPLLWLNSIGYMPQPVVDILGATVYFPLVWCIENSVTVREIWWPYQEFWEKLGKRPAAPRSSSPPPSASRGRRAVLALVRVDATPHFFSASPRLSG